MSKILDTRVTKLKSRSGGISYMTLRDYLNTVRVGGDYAQLVHQGRVAKMKGDKETYLQIKNQSQAAVLGVSEYEGHSHKKDEIISESGIFGVDIDGYANEEDVQRDFDKLKSDKYTVAVHRSFGGLGLVWIVKIEPEKVRQAYTGITLYLNREYNITGVDKQTSNINRLRYMSYDPQVYNCATEPNAFREYPKTVAAKKIPSILHTSNELEAFANRLTQAGKNLFTDYDTFYKGAAAIKSVEDNLTGNRVFHMIASMDAGYNEKDAERKWHAIGTLDEIGIGTLYYMAKQAGFTDFYTEDTKTIINATQMYKREFGKSANVPDARTYINTINPEIEVVDLDIVGKVINSSKEFVEGVNEGNLIAQLEKYVLGRANVKRNKYSGNLECEDGTPFDKFQESTLIVETKKYFNEKARDTDIKTILGSNYVPMYDPIQAFLDSHATVESNGSELEKLLNTITVDDEYQTEEYKRAMIFRWLMGLFSSRSREGHSPLVLVLQGKQGDGKSTWMRDLLPKELSEFFSEPASTMDEKDYFNEMATKLIVNQDEFGSKTVKDFTYFKELTSKKKMTFRLAYESTARSHDRLCIFGGTTNGIDIINDPTGNRRILPLRLKDDGIDFELSNSIDRTKLFLDIYREWNKDPENCHKLTREEFAMLQENSKSFIKVTTEQELLGRMFDVIEDHNHGLTITEIMQELSLKYFSEKIFKKAVVAGLATIGATMKSTRSGRKYNVRVRGLIA